MNHQGWIVAGCVASSLLFYSGLWPFGVCVLIGGAFLTLGK